MFLWSINFNIRYIVYKWETENVGATLHNKNSSFYYIQ